MEWLEAHAQGLKVYESNRRCTKCNATLRYLSNNGCVTCIRTRSTKMGRAGKHIGGILLVRPNLLCHPGDVESLHAANDAMLAARRAALGTGGAS